MATMIDGEAYLGTRYGAAAQQGGRRYHVPVAPCAACGASLVAPTFGVDVKGRGDYPLRPSRGARPTGTRAAMTSWAPAVPTLTSRRA